MENKLKSYLDACKFLKRNPKQLPNVTKLPKKDQVRIIATEKVDIIIQAINRKYNGGKKWIADFTNNNQYKYEIWWKKDNKLSGFRFAGTHWLFTYSCVGPRLSFVSHEAAKHFGENPEFVKLYNQMVKQ